MAKFFCLLGGGSYLNSTGKISTAKRGDLRWGPFRLVLWEAYRSVRASRFTGTALDARVWVHHCYFFALHLKDVCRADLNARTGTLALL